MGSLRGSLRDTSSVLNGRLGARGNCTKTEVTLLGQLVPIHTEAVPSSCSSETQLALRGLFCRIAIV